MAPALLWLVLPLLSAIPPSLGTQQAAAQEAASRGALQILGPDRLGETGTGSWGALWAPPVTDGPSMKPPTAGSNGLTITASWEEPPEYQWDFGDGTPPVETGRHPVASHEYVQDGTYTITVTATSAGTSETATHTLTVINNAPRVFSIQVLELPSSDALVELSTGAADSPEDLLEYRWHYGDGDSDAGTDLWRTIHRYPGPGTYQVVVEVVDAELRIDADTIELQVGEGRGEAVAPEEIEEPPVLTESVMAASVGGVVSTELDADVRSTMGLYLMRVASGMCRLTFTAWDDEHLAQVVTWVDLPGFPEEPSRIRFSTPPVYVTFHSDPDGYRTLRSLRSGGLESALRGFAGIDGSIAARMGALVGAVPGGPAEPPDEVRPGTPLVPVRADFRTTAGELELTIVPGERIEGVFDLGLMNPYAEHPTAAGPLSLSGTLSLDLQDALRRGILRPLDCGSPRFEIVGVQPEEGELHVDPGAFISVSFNAPYDPETMNASNVQVGWEDPDAPEGFVAVPGRMLRGTEWVRFVPDQPLLGGVRQTLRVRTGEEGVLGLNGAELEDPEEDGWESFTFETRVDFASPAAPGHALSCHVYQTTRDAPLIRGKPTVVRIYADWSELAGIPDDLQVKEIAGSVEVRSRRFEVLESTPYTFLRPDQWEAAGIQKKYAEHTANVFGWEPTGEEGDYLSVAVRVPTTGGETSLRYFTTCPIAHWDVEPELVLDYYLVGLDEWAAARGGTPSWASPAVHAAIAASEPYALQLLPLGSVRGRVRGFLDLHGYAGAAALVREGYGLGPLLERCGSDCAARLMAITTAAHTDADIVVGFGPWGVTYPTEQKGGSTHRGGRWGTSFIAMTVDSTSAGGTGDRLVMGLVHEYGHAFELEHLPSAPTAAIRAPIVGMRNSSYLWYDGIEGFRIDPDGRGGANKSSQEGNAETPQEWLAPLMFPATIPTGEAFIANHHYREAQAFWEARGDGRTGNAPDPPPPSPPQLGGALGLPLAGPAAWTTSAARDAVVSARQDPRAAVRFGGLMDAEGEVLLLTALVGAGPPRSRPERVAAAGEAPPTSPALDYRAALLDADGAVLSEMAFAPSEGSPSASELRAFSLSLPWAEAARRLVVSREGETLIERERSATPPTLRILPADPSAPGRVAWEASDPDGDSVEITVLYAPAPTEPWTVVAVGHPAHGSVSLDGTAIEPGPAPVVRVLANDGFDETPAEAGVDLETGLRVLAAFPREASNGGDAGTLALYLNSVLGALPEGALTLTDEGGRAIELVVEVPEGSRRITAWPAVPLAPGGTYRATLSAGVKDRWGNALAVPFTWTFRAGIEP